MTLELFNKALGYLYYEESTIDKYIRVLRDQGRKYCHRLVDLADILEKTNCVDQQKFIDAIISNSSDFTKLIVALRPYDEGNTKFIVSRLNISESEDVNVSIEDQAVSIIRHWRINQAFSSITCKGENGLVIDKDRAAELLTEMLIVNEHLKRNDQDARKKGEELILKTMKYNGITMPQNAITELIANTERWTEGASLSGDFATLFSFTKNDKPVGVISAIIMKLNGIKTDECRAFESKWKATQSINNPMYTEFTAMKVLGRLTAYYSPILDNEASSQESAPSFFY
jgi:hypothetical protein